MAPTRIPTRRRIDPLLNPFLHVAPSVAEMTADSKRGRSFAPVSPGVERFHRHIEVRGEFVDAEQAVFVFHPVIVREDPVTPMPFHGQSRVGFRDSTDDDAHRRLE